MIDLKTSMDSALLRSSPLLSARFIFLFRAVAVRLCRRKNTLTPGFHDIFLSLTLIPKILMSPGLFKKKLRISQLDCKISSQDLWLYL